MSSNFVIDKGEQTIFYRYRLGEKSIKNTIKYNVTNGITEGFVNKMKVVKRVMYRLGIEPTEETWLDRAGILKKKLTLPYIQLKLAI